MPGSLPVRPSPASARVMAAAIRAPAVSCSKCRSPRQARPRSAPCGRVEHWPNSDGSTPDATPSTPRARNDDAVVGTQGTDGTASRPGRGHRCQGILALETIVISPRHTIAGHGIVPTASSWSKTTGEDQPSHPVEHIDLPWGGRFLVSWEAFSPPELHDTSGVSMLGFGRRFALPSDQPLELPAAAEPPAAINT
jgi:hypothetical protein